MDILTNTKYKCDICHENYNCSEIKSCYDKQTCYECLSHYIKNEINAGIDIIACPYPDHKDKKCNINYNEIGIVISYADNTFKKIQENVIKKIFKDIEFVNYCPKCDYINIYINTNSITCSSCSHNYVVESKKQVIEVVDVQSEEWKSKYTKKCPQCGYHIQKIDGCSHVHCTKCDGDFDYDTLKIMYVAKRHHSNSTEKLKRIFAVENNRRLLQNYRYLLCFITQHISDLSNYTIFDSNLSKIESDLKKIDFVSKKIHPLNSLLESIISYLDKNDSGKLIDLIIQCPFLIGQIDNFSNQYLIIDKLRNYGELLSNVANDKTVLQYFINGINSGTHFDHIIKIPQVFNTLKINRIFRNTLAENKYIHHNTLYGYTSCYNLYNSSVLFDEIMNRSIYAVYTLVDIIDAKNVTYLENICTNNKQDFIGFLNFCDFIDTIGEELIDLMPQHSTANLFMIESVRKEIAKIGNDDDMSFDKKFELVKKYANIHINQIYHTVPTRPSRLARIDSFDQDDHLINYNSGYKISMTADDYRRFLNDMYIDTPDPVPMFGSRAQPVQPVQPVRYAQPVQYAQYAQPSPVPAFAPASASAPAPAPASVQYIQSSQPFRMPSGIQTTSINTPIMPYMYHQYNNTR